MGSVVLSHVSTQVTPGSLSAPVRVGDLADRLVGGGGAVVDGVLLAGAGVGHEADDRVGGVHDVDVAELLDGRVLVRVRGAVGDEVLARGRRAGRADVVGHVVRDADRDAGVGSGAVARVERVVELVVGVRALVGVRRCALVHLVRGGGAGGVRGGVHGDDREVGVVAAVLRAGVGHGHGARLGDEVGREAAAVPRGGVRDMEVTKYCAW